MQRQTHCIAKDDLELLTLQPLPLECRAGRNMSLCQVYSILAMEPRTSCLVDKHSTNRATAQAISGYSLINIIFNSPEWVGANALLLSNTFLFRRAQVKDVGFSGAILFDAPVQTGTVCLGKAGTACSKQGPDIG